jgi:uncharacterized membrane protein YqaE (UPF0057 family)
MDIFIYFILAIMAYFLPSIIATSKKRKNTTAIFTLNLLLGWTLIGWIVALIWSVSE